MVFEISSSQTLKCDHIAYHITIKPKKHAALRKKILNTIQKILRVFIQHTTTINHKHGYRELVPFVFTVAKAFLLSCCRHEDIMGRRYTGVNNRDKWTAVKVFLCDETGKGGNTPFFVLTEY